MKEIKEIVFEEKKGNAGNIGLITLNRPQVLNALNHDMFLALDEHLAVWENQASIKAVVIRAVEGRAFCAGGDIRHAHTLKKSNDPALVKFFQDEYRMNTRIHHYPKPYIALLDGITMGGGVGISIHGSHRVGTERLVFAMPETGIGFYPDVGTTYYLSRMPYKTGYYLGLTGARITYADCLAIGIIQELVAQDSLDILLSELLEAPLPDKAAVTTFLQKYALKSPPSALLEHKNEIETCFSKNTVEEIIQALEHSTSTRSLQTADTLKAKSPTSLKVTLHALQQAVKMDFDECMQMEIQLTTHFLHNHDFFEGIRAVVIDKDQKPQWNPAKLTDVTHRDIEKFFMPSTQELV